MHASRTRAGKNLNIFTFPVCRRDNKNVRKYITKGLTFFLLLSKYQLVMAVAQVDLSSRAWVGRVGFSCSQKPQSLQSVLLMRFSWRLEASVYQLFKRKAHINKNNKSVTTYLRDNFTTCSQLLESILWLIQQLITISDR